MLTAEEVATLTDEEVAACAEAERGEPPATSSMKYWRMALSLPSQRAHVSKAVAKAREILDARRGAWERKTDAMLSGWLRGGANAAPSARGETADEYVRTVTAIAGTPPPRDRCATDGCTRQRTVASMWCRSHSPVAAGPPLVPVADELFRFLCGLDGTVTARWLSVEDQREFERLRRGLGEALMAMGRGRR